MKKSTKIALVLLSLLALGIATYTYAYFNLGLIAGVPSDIPHERLVIQSVFVNNTVNSIFLTVKSAQNNIININNAIVNDAKGINVAFIPLSYSILEGETKTLIVNCTLASGSYTVTLATSKGSSFGSPPFNVS